jgi:hypothetical protein
MKFLSPYCVMGVFFAEPWFMRETYGLEAIRERFYCILDSPVKENDS